MAVLKSAIQKMLSATATVTEVEGLSPRIRRIRLGGPRVAGIPWRPGDKVKLACGPKMRSYTPARVDAAAGWMDVVFFLHGNGAASDWASAAKVGDEVGFLGPARSMPVPEESPDWALFLGDETTIGLAAACLGALPDRTPVLGAIELSTDDAGAIDAFGLPLSPAIRRTSHGEALLAWLAETPLPKGQGIAWLSGEANSVLALKSTLLRQGMDRAALQIKPYWSTRGHLHRKALQKQL
ncbi:MAG: NADPH-dependent ferric siderophore reductase [Myxococcota bacterium]|jgi:NADPH-dependent ferric siderophore reductase